MQDKVKEINRNSIGESREDYLEAIYMLIKENGACRPTDIAVKLSVSKPSVSVALNKLEAENYIRRDDWKIILTESGNDVACRTLQKHNFFKDWLMAAGIDKSTAEQEACHIEHVISDDSFDKIEAYTRVSPQST